MKIKTERHTYLQVSSGICLFSFLSQDSSLGPDTDLPCFLHHLDPERDLFLDLNLLLTASLQSNKSCFHILPFCEQLYLTEDMAKKDKSHRKNKDKAKAKPEPSPFDGLSPPDYTLPPPTYEPFTHTQRGSAMPALSSDLPTNISTGLQDSPTYIAQQALHRRRNIDGIENGLEDVLGNANASPSSHIRFDDGQSGCDTESEKEQGEEQEVMTKTEDDEDDGAAMESDLLSDIQNSLSHEAEFQEQPTMNGLTSPDNSGTGASSRASSQAASTTSSHHDETDEDDTIRPPTGEAMSGSDDDNDIETSSAKRHKPSSPYRRPRTSVATRNPPPPELETQFKYTNSIVGNNIYRYPKVVLDSLGEMEDIIPKTVMSYVEKNPGKRVEGWMKGKGKDGDDEGTKRMLVGLEGARRVLSHVSAMRVQGNAGVGGEERKMGEELRRIAGERGGEVEELRAQVRVLREEVAELKDGKKKRKRG